jgi:hypothetical protein
MTIDRSLMIMIDRINQRLCNRIRLSTDIDQHGVIRWLATGTVLSSSSVTVAVEMGLPVNLRACERVRLDDMEYEHNQKQAA